MDATDEMLITRPGSVFVASLARTSVKLNNKVSEVYIWREKLDMYACVTEEKDIMSVMQPESASLKTYCKICF